jgi:hypothetical protein
MALTVQILSQSKDIREAVRTADIVELIDKVHLANRHLKLNSYDAVTEIYARNGTLLAGEPCTRYPLCPPDVVAEVLQGKIMSFREIVDGHLRICSAAPMYHENESGPIGVVVISLFSTHQFAEEVKKIIGTEMVFFGFVDERCLLFGSTFREAGERVPVDICVAESTQPAFDKTLAGRGFMFQSMPLEAQNGRLFIATAVEKALVGEMIVLLGDNLIKIGVAAVFFAILLALVFSSTLTRPINSLVTSAQASALAISRAVSASSRTMNSLFSAKPWMTCAVKSRARSIS